MSVPTCKYFARGTCRYGDRCRFYHPPGGGGGQQQGYYNQGDNSRGAGVYNQIQESRFKLNESVRIIEEMVKKDMIEWEKGKIWPFSCYGPTGGKPNLEGFEDISPEELRLATMQNNGALPNNIPMKIQLWERARAKWQQTTQENLAALEQLILGPSFQQGQQTNAGFGNTQTSFAGGQFNANSSNFQNQSLFATKPNNSALGNFSFNLTNQNQGQTNAMESAQRSMGSLSSFSFNQAMAQPPALLPGSQPPFSQGFPQAQQQTMNQGFPQAQQPAMTQGFPQAQQPTMNQGFPTGLQLQQSQVLGQGFALGAQSQQPPQGFALASQAQPQHLNSAFNTMQPQQPSTNPGFFASAQPQPQAPSSLGAFSFSLNQAPAVPNAFVGAAPQASIFPGMQNMGAGNQAAFSGSPFGAAGGTMDAVDDTMYSKMTDLSQNEIQAFEAPRFDIDTLPLHAPAKKFCF